MLHETVVHLKVDYLLAALRVPLPPSNVPLRVQFEIAANVIIVISSQANFSFSEAVRLGDHGARYLMCCSLE